MAEARFAPALEQVAAWQHALGRACDEAAALADPFLRRRFDGAVRRVADELRRVEDADNVDAALLEAMERARALLGDARALLLQSKTARGAVDRTLKVIGAIDKALTEARLPTADAAGLHAPAEPPPLPPLHASRGVPQRFRIDREVVLPGRRRRVARDDEDDADPAQAWRLFPPIDAPELKTAASRRALDPVVRARDQVVRLLEAALAELGALGWLRRSSDSDGWYEGLQRFEDRLLTQLDAVFAAGRPVHLAVSTSIEEGWERRRIAVDLPQILLSWSEDAVPGDTSRAFCRALVLGCMRGADAARAAVSSLDAPTGLDRRAAIEALALASSPDVDEALREACRAPRFAAAALEVTRRRGTTDVASALAALASPDDKLARAAARALGSAPDRELACGALHHALMAGVTLEVECALCESALRLAASWVVRHVRERTRSLSSDDPTLTEWLRLLALSADRGDALVLRERTGDDIERLEAWGYAGRVELAEALLERIEGYPRGVTPRAHLSIFERITGIVAPEPFDAPALRAQWNALKGSLDVAVRYRRGRPLSLAVVLESLGEWGRVQRERRITSLEVAMLSGGKLRIDPDDWVARQRARVAVALSDLHVT